MSHIPNLSLADGRAIPQLGFGTWQIPPQQTARAVEAAIRAGYRHIDTAQMYRNEREVGEGIRAADVPREQIFLATKLSNSAHEPLEAERAFERSLVELDTDHVDLFLIHWPMVLSYGGDFPSTWRVMERFVADGRARSIGVSNFRIVDLERLLRETDIIPAVNQIEAHPYFPNDAVRRFGAAHGIVTEAWSPLAQGLLPAEPVVRDVAAKHERTPAQVVLRWHIQRGDVVFPKTVKPARMRENLAVFDFGLDGEDLDALDALDRGAGGRIGPDPDTFDFRPD